MRVRLLADCSSIVDISLRVSLFLGLSCLASPPMASGTQPPIVIESARLIMTAGPAKTQPTYTLAGDTRPVVTLPREKRVSLSRRGGSKDLQVVVPFTLAEGEKVVVSGTYHTAGTTVLRIPPSVQTVTLRNGSLVATLPLPVIARIPGTKTDFSLLLAPLANAGGVEHETAPVIIPPHARLEISLGIAGSGRFPGADRVKFTVALKQAGQGEREILNRVIDPASPAAGAWIGAAAELGRFANVEASFVLRAQSLGKGISAQFALLGQPRVMRQRETEERPRNIILVSLDTLGARHLGTYGGKRPTSPVLDELAQESVVFDRAFAQWPETAGSHMTIFTGTYVSNHGVKNFVSRPRGSLRTLPQRLSEHGYRTKAFTEDGGIWAEAGFARGFDSYVERRSPDFVYRGEAVGTFTDACEWVRSHANQLFFLLIHTYQVHAPYRPPPGYRKALVKTDPGDPVARDELNYDREVAFTDKQVARLIATLKELGLEEQTLVVITSDHGEEFGEHGGRGHGRTLYSEVMHIPLIFWAPGYLKPQRVNQLVGLVDLAPTILELVGLDPHSDGLDGRSLAGFIGPQSRKEQMGLVFSELDREGVRMLAVRSPEATLIQDLSSGKSLCYLATDTRETNPLTSGCKALKAAAQKHLANISATPGVTSVEVDAETKAKMKALGYLQ